MKSALINEFTKLKKARIVSILLFLYAFIPIVIGILFYIAQRPELIEKMGLIGAKSEMFGQGDWRSYLLLTNQVMAGLGYIGFGFFTSWTFGREFAEKMINDLLALPLSRSMIVLSKFTIIFLICISFTLVFNLSTLLAGKIFSIENYNFNDTLVNFKTLISIGVLTCLLMPFISFFASFGKGYLLPMGFVILTLIFAQFAGIMGLGPYFPWSIPGMLSIPSIKDIHILSSSSYIILIISAIIGTLATTIWWQKADHQ